MWARNRKLRRRSSGNEPDGNEIRVSRIPGSVQIQIILHIIRDFFANTSLHGYRHIWRHGLHWTERVWWIVSCSISLYLCSRFIQNLWIHWSESPVVITFENRATPIEMIPFPAVTICPRTKATADKLNFTDSWLTMMNYLQSNESEKMKFPLSPEKFSRFKAILPTCDNKDALNILYESLGENFTDNSVYEILRDLSPYFIRTKSNCSRLSDERPCSHYLKPVFTDEGICYTFNILNSDEIYSDLITPELLTVTDNPKRLNWDTEYGYNESILDDHGAATYPFRGIGTGYRAGFKASLLFADQDTNHLCSAIHGFKVLLHRPDELPQLSDNFFHVPIRSNVIMSIQPHMFTTSDDLVAHPPTDRGCYLNNERHLRYFQRYNQKNCKSECFANYTLEECGCVHFAMPRDWRTKICGISKMKCYVDAIYKSFKHSIVQKCNCLPGCWTVAYDVELSYASLSNRALISQLSVSYKEHDFVSSKRSQLYSDTDFIANCGGLLGLFTGFSMLSLVELFYYCTLKLGCAMFSQRTSTPQTEISQIETPRKRDAACGVCTDESGNLFEKLNRYPIHGRTDSISIISLDRTETLASGSNTLRRSRMLK